MKLKPTLLFKAAAMALASRSGLALGLVSLPNGSQIHIASGYGASKAISAFTNASDGVSTLEAAHGIVVGDYAEITNGWSRMTDKILKAVTVSTNDVTWGVDTTSTAIYPAGGGVGTLREITGWTQLTQVLNTNSTGGEQQFTEFQFLEADAQRRLPTTKSAGGLTISVADDPTLAGFILAGQANDDRLPRAVRVTLPSGKVILYNAYISLNRTPSLTVNSVMACEVTLSFRNEPTRY